MGCRGAGHLPETGFLSPGGTTPLRQRGEAGSAWGCRAGPPSGSPPQPKRHRHSCGKGGPRKLHVRHAARSMAGVLPKAEALTVTLRTGQSNRQRKESRPARASFLCGPGGGLVFPPAVIGGSIPKRRSGGLSIPFKRSSAGVFQARDQLLPCRAGRLPVFPGGVIRIAGPTTQLRGFPIAGAARFFPILAGWRPGSSPGSAAVRSWTMPRLRCPGQQARLASLPRSHVEERSGVTASMTARRLWLSPSACLSVRRWKGIAGTGSCPPRWMSKSMGGTNSNPQI